MEASDVRRTLSRLRVDQVLGAVVALLLVVLLLDLFRQLLTGELEISRLRRYVWQGILVGLIYGLAGIGLSMTYSILRFANFSHGDLLTTGAFSGWSAAYLIAGFSGFGAYMIPEFGDYDLGNLLLLAPNNDPSSGTIGMTISQRPLAILGGLVVAAVVTVLVALAADRLVYKRLRDESAIALLIASVGVAFVVRYLIAFVYTRSRRAPPASAPEETIDAGVASSTVDLHQATLVVSAVLLMAGVHALLQYTKLGTSMRAMADNRDLARITGIPTERVVLLTWIVGAALAGMAGFLILMTLPSLTYNKGWLLLLPIFAGVILGGIGSIYGAIAGGLVIGLVSQVANVWLPPSLTMAAAFLVMIMVLIFRPEGLFGGVKTA